MQLDRYKIIFAVLLLFGIMVLLRYYVDGFTQLPLRIQPPTFFGTGGIPLATEMRYTDEPPANEKIYTISGNKVGPECCPSAYSTSSGCICPLFR